MTKPLRQETQGINSLSHDSIDNRKRFPRHSIAYCASVDEEMGEWENGKIMRKLKRGWEGVS
jgi:hypothetical protein